MLAPDCFDFNTGDPMTSEEARYRAADRKAKRIALALLFLVLVGYGVLAFWAFQR